MEVVDAVALFRSLFEGPVIAAGGFDGDTAAAAVAGAQSDAVAFGRLFTADPDPPSRLTLDARLNAYDRTTFCGGDEHGDTDSPALTEAAAP